MKLQCISCSGTNVDWMAEHDHYSIASQSVTHKGSLLPKQQLKQAVKASYARGVHGDDYEGTGPYCNDCEDSQIECLVVDNNGVDQHIDDMWDQLEALTGIKASAL